MLHLARTHSARKESLGSPLKQVKARRGTSRASSSQSLFPEDNSPDPSSSTRRRFLLDALVLPTRPPLPLCLSLPPRYLQRCNSQSESEIRVGKRLSAALSPRFQLYALLRQTSISCGPIKFLHKPTGGSDARSLRQRRAPCPHIGRGSGVARGDDRWTNSSRLI